MRAARTAGGAHDGLAIELAICDQRLKLSLGKQTVLEYDFEPIASEVAPSGPGLEIGVEDAAIRLGKLDVLRDVYYTQVPGGPNQYRLGPNEYFVLGDNSPHSVDSRVWAMGGGVSSGLLLGPALAW